MINLGRNRTMDGPEDEDILGLPVMTKAELQKAALEHSGYSTPHLNVILCELCIVRYYAIVTFYTSYEPSHND